jgi:hypothetical protein
MGAKYVHIASPSPTSEGFPLNTKHLPTESGALIDAHLLHTIGVDPSQASPSDLMLAVSQMARTQLSERWVETQTEERQHKARRVVYLSMEFLMGRTLSNALGALELTEDAARGVRQHAQKLEDIADREPDAALGNGGLGRLAACFLDSMATLGLPSWGYGIRYEYGMFAQHIAGGSQQEYPDPGCSTALPGSFRAPTSLIRCGLEAGWSTLTVRRSGAIRAKWRPKPMTWWSRVTAPRRSAHCGYGKRWHPPTLTWALLIPVTTTAPPAPKTSSRIFPGCCIPMTARRPAASCGSSRSIFLLLRRCRIWSSATWKNIRRWPTWQNTSPFI